MLLDFGRVSPSIRTLVGEVGEKYKVKALGILLLQLIIKNSAVVLFSDEGILSVCDWMRQLLL